MPENKLRIGLLLDSFDVPAWVFSMINDIQNSNHSEISLIVKNDVQPTKKKVSVLKRFIERKDEVLYLLHLILENKLFKLSPDPFALKTLNDIVSCPTINVTPKKTKFSDIITQEDVNKIKNFDIDIFIRIGFRILRGEILNCAKYGVWSYHHGDNNLNRGRPAGAHEVLENWEVTGVILQILTEDLDGGTKLYSSFSRTDDLSINRNKFNLYWKAKSFIPRKIKELAYLGEKAFFEKIQKENAHPHFYYNQLFKNPGNLKILTGVLSSYWRAVKKKLVAKFYTEQWILLFKLNKKEELATTFFTYKKIMPPKDRFWADPFALFRNDKYYIFYEEYLYKERKGNISVIEMDEKGNYRQLGVALKKEYHLSYPFLFEDNSILYMIPETAQNNSIELYKCSGFPLKWEFQKTLIENIHAVDATIFKYNGKYWMFANVKETEGASIHDELFLFYTDHLLEASWTPHPLNPIVSDVRKARPAGEIFSVKDKIYRPSQNCAKHYGRGIQIHEITTLNETEYEERQVQSIYPNWEKDLIGTHTINRTKNLTVIDALRKTRR